MAKSGGVKRLAKKSRGRAKLSIAETFEVLGFTSDTTRLDFLHTVGAREVCASTCHPKLPVAHSSLPEK